MARPQRGPQEDAHGPRGARRRPGQDLGSGALAGGSRNRSRSVRMHAPAHPDGGAVTRPGDRHLTVPGPPQSTPSWHQGARGLRNQKPGRGQFLQDPRGELQREGAVLAPGAHTTLSPSSGAERGGLCRQASRKLDGKPVATQKTGSPLPMPASRPEGSWRPPMPHAKLGWPHIPEITHPGAARVRLGGQAAACPGLPRWGPLLARRGPAAPLPRTEADGGPTGSGSAGAMRRPTGPRRAPGRRKGCAPRPGQSGQRQPAGNRELEHSGKATETQRLAWEGPGETEAASVRASGQVGARSPEGRGASAPRGQPPWREARQPEREAAGPPTTGTGGLAVRWGLAWT